MFHVKRSPPDRRHPPSCGFGDREASRASTRVHVSMCVAEAVGRRGRAHETFSRMARSVAAGERGPVAGLASSRSRRPGAGVARSDRTDEASRPRCDGAQDDGPCRRCRRTAAGMVVKTGSAGLEKHSAGEASARHSSARVQSEWCGQPRGENGRDARLRRDRRAVRAGDDLVIRGIVTWHPCAVSSGARPSAMRYCVAQFTSGAARECECAMDRSAGACGADLAPSPRPAVGWSCGGVVAAWCGRAVVSSRHGVVAPWSLRGRPLSTTPPGRTPRRQKPSRR